MTTGRDGRTRWRWWRGASDGAARHAVGQGPFAYTQGRQSLSLRTTAAAAPGRADDCEERHRPIEGLVWRVFGGFVAVLVSLVLAGAAQVTLKADRDDLRRVESRAYELERTLAAMQSQLAEIGASQRHVREDVAYLRKLLDEERRTDRKEGVR